MPPEGIFVEGKEERKEELDNANADQEKKILSEIGTDSANKTLLTITPKNILDNSYLIFKEINAFNNSHAIEGNHLVTGHVLRRISTGNLFLVVTPACDLVPGRKIHNKIHAKLQSLYPANTALKQMNDRTLTEADIFTKAKSLINSKKLLFLFLADTNVEIFSSVLNIYDSPEPNIKSVVIENDGIWGETKELTVYEANLTKAPPEYDGEQYEVIAQLRYEYALHHSKISGEYHSRIGLGYQ